MKVLQINSVCNTGSTGRICEDIGSILIDKGYDSYIAFGRKARVSSSTVLKIGSTINIWTHGMITALFDRHGFASRAATRQFLDKVASINPEIIHLHNLHGYYINIELLFDFVRRSKIPTVWTLHDSWAYTGHCTYYDSAECDKWMTECSRCPKSRYYPASYVLDQSTSNFRQKKQLYGDLENLFIVTPCEWLSKHVHRSFLNQRSISTIYNGIDVQVFSPRQSRPISLTQNTKKIVLGVASSWDQRKGLQDFLRLQNLLGERYQTVLVGLTDKQIKGLPQNIIGIKRTESVDELAEYYSAADVFVNPTYQDNFPTTNLEALGCGTPVVTYRTGGSPEALDADTGFVVDKGNMDDLAARIRVVVENGKTAYRRLCRNRAVTHFDKNDRYAQYISLYEQLIT